VEKKDGSVENLDLMVLICFVLLFESGVLRGFFPCLRYLPCVFERQVYSHMQITSQMRRSWKLGVCTVLLFWFWVFVRGLHVLFLYVP
jgi:hypothetical protein